jgi:hypothetical protein
MIDTEKYRLRVELDCGQRLIAQTRKLITSSHAAIADGNKHC